MMQCLILISVYPDILSVSLEDKFLIKLISNDTPLYYNPSGRSIHDYLYAYQPTGTNLFSIGRMLLSHRNNTSPSS